MMMIPPFMHGAAQWAAFNAVTMGGRMVIPDDVRARCDPPTCCASPPTRGVLSMPVGRRRDRPSAARRDRAGDYDLSGLLTITNGGAPLSPTVRERILERAAHLMLIDAVGVVGDRRADEHVDARRAPRRRPRRSRPQSDTAVVVGGPRPRCSSPATRAGLAGPAGSGAARVSGRRGQDRRARSR